MTRGGSFSMAIMYLQRGEGEQIAIKSWWPLHSTFEGCGETHGCWAHYLEDGFAERLQKNSSSEGVVLANNLSPAVSGKLDSEFQSGSEVSKMLSRPQLSFLRADDSTCHVEPEALRPEYSISMPIRVSTMQVR